MHAASDDQAQLQFPFSQRWFHGRTSFRPSQEPLDPQRYGVEAIEYAVAKAFVVEHHYSGTFSPCIQSYGLFRKAGEFLPSILVGVATFAPTSNPHSVTRWTGLDNAAGAELARFVLLSEEPGNSESWFLARALAGFKAARPGVKVVLSYSDPVPRTALDGRQVFVGHYGCIYGASNALYMGRASPKTQYLNADGRVIANRILSKLRNGEVGRQYAENVLTEVAGVAREPDGTGASFVTRALGCLRAQHHPGNHLYAFPLAADRREKRQILSLPVLQAHSLGIAAYPKHPDALAA
jgi:hypothetical protein